MGIFSTPTIITTAVSRTLLVKNKPDLIKDSIIGAVLTDRSISGSIIAELLGGFVARVDRFYRYGRDTYVRGLPSSTGYSNGSNEQGVKDLLDILHGEPVTITELLIDKPTDDALAWEYLQNNWDWDSATNIVHKVPPGIRFPPDPNTLMPTTYSVSSNYMRFFFEYSYNNSTYTDQLDFNVPDNNTGTNYYMVEYYLDSDPTKKALFWNHRIDTSTLPEFNYEREMPDTKYPYYPIAILRHNKRDIDADVTTDEFITTNKLIGILGFEVTEVLDQVRENPERDKLDDVFLLCLC